MKAKQITALLQMKSKSATYSFGAIFAMAFSTSEASTTKCSASRVKSSRLASSVALEAILVNSAACSRSFINCACMSCTAAYSGGLSSLLIQRSAAFMGSSLSHFSQANSVPAVVIRRVNGPRHFGHLSDGNKRGMVI